MHYVFLDKVFKRTKEDKSIALHQANNAIQTNEDMSVGAATPVETVKIEYNPHFSLLSKEEQKQVIDFIRPITDRWQVMNLKLSYGVRMEKENLLLVSYKTENERVKDIGKTLYTRFFVVIHNEDCFETRYTSDNMNDEGKLLFSIPDEYEEPLKHAMNFYRNWSEHRVFEKTCKAQEPPVDVIAINNSLIAPLHKEYERYEEEQKKQKMARRKSVEINSEEVAKEIFFSCQPYAKLEENYTEETIKAFEQFATSEKIEEWVIEECKQILVNIVQGDRENIYDKLEKINGRCGYFLGVSSDVLAEDYTQACKALFASGEERFIVCIHTYLSYLKNSQNPSVAKELMDMTERYYKEKYPEEYAHGSIDSHPQRFKSICCMLRGRIRELTSIDNSEGFQFVLTGEEYLRQIVIWYSNKYNDDAAVKESIADLNCANGVENDKVFLTAGCSEADSYFQHDWDLWFVAILKETGEVLEFRCRREAEDGGFVADYYDGFSTENWLLLESALEFYRNQQERRLFFETYSQEHEGKSIDDLMKTCHNGLLSKFKRHYEKEYKRIKDNPLKKTLLKIMDLCEEKGPAYGYKNTVIEKPVAENEIAAWETEWGISLPDSYKYFLRFANGIQFFDSSEYISGLKGLNPLDEYLGADYIHMGEMIGDGTMICISKTNGRVYVADHGEYDDKGDFAEFLEYFVGFLEGI